MSSPRIPLTKKNARYKLNYLFLNFEARRPQIGAHILRSI